MEAALVIATEEELFAVCRGWQKTVLFAEPVVELRLNAFTGGQQRAVRYFDKPTSFPNDVAWYARILEKLPRFELDWLYGLEGFAMQPDILRVLMPALTTMDEPAIERAMAQHVIGPRCHSTETELVYRLPTPFLEALATSHGDALGHAARAVEAAGYKNGSGVLVQLAAMARGARESGKNVYAVYDFAGETSPPDDADPRDTDWWG